jgi:hypothetical protein
VRGGSETELQKLLLPKGKVNLGQAWDAGAGHRKVLMDPIKDLLGVTHYSAGCPQRPLKSLSFCVIIL